MPFPGMPFGPSNAFYSEAAGLPGGAPSNGELLWAAQHPSPNVKILCVKTLLKHRKTLFAKEPPEPKTGTARTVPPPNRNQTEPGPPVFGLMQLLSHLTATLESSRLGSQHPSPNVKTLCNFELQIWPENDHIT